MIKRYFYIILVLVCLVLNPVFANEGFKLEVVYPKTESIIKSNKIFVVGNTNPGAKLRIAGKKAKVYKDGSFVKVIDIPSGKNVIKLRSYYKGKTKTLDVIVTVPVQKTIPHTPLKIDKNTLNPAQNIIYKPGDKLEISFKGSTGNKAYFNIGGKDYPMYEQPARHIHIKKYYHKHLKNYVKYVKGHYKGTYKIKKDDNFRNEKIKVKLVSKNDVEVLYARGEISVIPASIQPIVAKVIKDDAVVRDAPYQNRLTPFPKETRVNITGKISPNYRVKLSNHRIAWINEKYLEVLPTGTIIPQSDIEKISLATKKDYSYIRIPLNSNIPFRIRDYQTKIKIDFYNAIDKINNFNFVEQKFIKNIIHNQISKDTVRIEVSADNFWGYNYYYEGNDFVIALKNPPIVNSAKPLQGKIIVVDPGHGADELGAVGPTGVTEKEINLYMSKYLKQYLEQEGAIVYMTRSIDKKVPIYDRIDIARMYNPDILISVHNNSLPDGKNPYKEHGTSAFYYHPQSYKLAKSINRSLVEQTKLKQHGVKKASFVLTRPNEMLAVLVEVAFMINPYEYQLINQKTFQKKSAKAISDGIKNFLLNN